MTPGLGFALAAMVCFGIGDLVYKRGAAAGIEAGEFVMLQAWAFCPGVTLYAWLTGTLDLRLAALWGALAGAFLFLAMFNFAASLRGGAVSTNAPIFRLNFTLTAALAILLLGEALTLVKAAALVCALAAVWLLLADPGTKRDQIDIGSLVRVVIATVAMALTNFFHKIGLQHGALPETMVSTQAWMFTSLAMILRFWRNDGFHITPGAWRYSTLAALVLAAAFIALMHGLAVGPASVLVPVAQMSFVFTAAVGAALFHERLDWRKRSGLVVAVAALALFAIG
ncbi:MAG TPA: EamA family transporter [Xanthobacteraceae bacterium]|nr:EamA family transporter [Xanthobacteraceae bacterium]